MSEILTERTHIVVQKILIVMLNYNKNSFLMASSNGEDSAFLH